LIRYRTSCGAKTRRGTPCQRPGTGQGGRCHLHGGESTGPKSTYGRAAIGAAQKTRWADWRAKNPRLLPDLSAQQERKVRQAFAAATGIAFDRQRAQEVDQWRVEQDSQRWLQRALKRDREENDRLADLRAAVAAKMRAVYPQWAQEIEELYGPARKTP
jgi:hypothetical protein